MGKKRIILLSSLDGFTPLLVWRRIDLKVDHLSSQDSIDWIVQSHLICLASLFPIQLPVNLVLGADSSIKFLVASWRRGVNGFSDAFLQAFLLILAEPEYLGLGYNFLLYIASDGKIKLLPPQKSLIFRQIIRIFCEFSIWFREFTIGTIEIFIALIAIPTRLFIFVNRHFVLMRAMEDTEWKS